MPSEPVLPADYVAIHSTYWKELMAAIEAVLDGFHEEGGSVPRNLIEDLDNAHFVAFTEGRTHRSRKRDWEPCALCGNVHDPDADCPVRPALTDGDVNDA